MLTGYQTEVVAFDVRDSGEYTCGACTAKATSQLTVDKAERGLTNAYGVSAIIRYELDEMNGQSTYEAAEERIDRFADEHPAIFGPLVEGDEHAEARLVDRVADKLGDLYHERCGHCDEVLA
jgi:hypothetical protein